jgi:hypothetical protein
MSGGVRYAGKRVSADLVVDRSVTPHEFEQAHDAALNRKLQFA